MAVEVLEIWSRQTDGGDSATKGFTVKGALSVSHARISAGVPKRGDAHPTAVGLWAQKPVAKRVGFNLYEVEVQYSSDRGSTSDDTDPLADPPSYEWSIGLQSIERDTDIDGNPILNSARDRFDQNAPTTETQIYLTITRNVPFFDVPRSLLFTNSVNIADLTIPLAGAVKAGNVKCLGIVPAQSYTRDSQFIVEVSRFEIAPYDLSLVRILDAGFFAVVAEGGDPVELGNAPPGGFKLNGKGGVLPRQGTAGSDISTNVPGFPAAPTGAIVETYPPEAGVPEAVWLKWKMLKKREFGELGLFNV